MIRRPSFETKIHHERWLVSYADFITLLFAFFVVMYSISQVSEAKYKALSSVLDETFSNVAKDSEIPSDIERGNPEPASVAEMSELHSELKQVLGDMASAGEINIQGNELWVEVEVNSNLLFASGSAEPSQQAREIFSRVASVLSPYENAVEVSGHTDSVPIRNRQFKNNWELSAARAVQVVNLLSGLGVAPQRMAATGYGEHRPIADNTSEEGRSANRRVVLRVAKDVAETPKLEPEKIVSGDSVDLVTPENPPQPNTIDDEEPPIASPEELQKSVEPIRLRDGGLLFTSDPELPRNNR